MASRPSHSGSPSQKQPQLSKLSVLRANDSYRPAVSIDSYPPSKSSRALPNLTAAYPSLPVRPSGPSPSNILDYRHRDKDYCSFWLRTGRCAYLDTALGCKYRHEVPDQQTLRNIGIHEPPSEVRKRLHLQQAPLLRKPPIGPSTKYIPDVTVPPARQPRSKAISEASITSSGAFPSRSSSYRPPPAPNNTASRDTLHPSQRLEAQSLQSKYRQPAFVRVFDDTAPAHSTPVAPWNKHQVGAGTSFSKAGSLYENEAFGGDFERYSLAKLGWCDNYGCEGPHSHDRCPLEKCCSGCRSRNHFWSECPMTCKECGSRRHAPKYCEDFTNTNGWGIAYPRRLRAKQQEQRHKQERKTQKSGSPAALRQMPDNWKTPSGPSAQSPVREKQDSSEKSELIQSLINPQSQQPFLTPSTTAASPLVASFQHQRPRSSPLWAATEELPAGIRGRNQSAKPANNTILEEQHPASPRDDGQSSTSENARSREASGSSEQHIEIHHKNASNDVPFPISGKMKAFEEDQYFIQKRHEAEMKRREDERKLALKRKVEEQDMEYEHALRMTKLRRMESAVTGDFGNSRAQNDLDCAEEDGTLVIKIED